MVKWLSMPNSQPQPLTPKDWLEIGTIPAVRESWGVLESEDFSEAAASIYAVKFDFCSGSPGYVGELFILQGDALTGDAPLMLRRANNGTLIVI